MKTSTIILLGIGAYLLYKATSGNGYVDNSGYGSGGGTPGQMHTTFLETQRAQQESLSGGKTNPIQVINTSLDLSPVSHVSPDRFSVVQYTGSRKIGVLDRAAQQSIEYLTAVKRAANPFSSALAAQKTAIFKKSGLVSTEA